MVLQMKSKTHLENILKYNISNDAFVVLGVGQVQTRKGVMDFIDVANKMPDTTFVWCGGFSFGRITDGYDELKKVYENPPKNVSFSRSSTFLYVFISLPYQACHSGI